MHKLTRFCFLLFLAATVSAAPEERRWYQVELVVFKNLDVFAGASENWNYARVPVDYPLGSSTLEKYLSTPKNQLNLQGTVNFLNKHRNYQVLVHRGWIQPAYSSDTAAPVRVTGGTAIEIQARKPDRTDLPFYQQDPLEEIIEAPSYLNQLEGFITLMVNRYIHLEINLTLREYEQESASVEVIEIEPEETGLVDELGARMYHYQLLHQRRVRTGEIHYFDHPKFGVIAQVNPAMPPDPLPDRLQQAP